MSNALAPGGGPPAAVTPLEQATARVRALMGRLTGPGARDLVEKVARTAATVATDTSIPALSGGLKLLSDILQKVQQMSITLKEVETLNDRLQHLSDMFDSALNPPNDLILPARFQLTAEKMLLKCSEAVERLNKIKAKSKLGRYVASKADSTEVAGLISEINASLQDFQAGIAAHTDIGIQRVEGITQQTENNLRTHAEATHSGFSKILAQGETVQSGVDNILAREETAQSGIDELLARVETMNIKGKNILKVVQTVESKVDNMTSSQQEHFLPRFAKRAQYNAVDVRRSCLSGTRAQPLERLRQWVTIACTQRDILLGGSHGNIYWICGFAGSGKTTIAFSIADWCRVQKILGGNFFISRSDAECKDPELIFTTISRQLCDFNPAYKAKVVALLQKDPTIQHSGASRQFEELIVRPLEELRKEGKVFTCAIVIDALDECDDSKATSTILATLAQYISRIAEFLVFVVTSRPERRVAALFEGAHRHSLSGVTKPLVLHTIELNSVLFDIKAYLQEGLNDVIALYEVDEGWPFDRDLNRLVELSAGLFIWAATALAFVLDEEFNDPQGQLKQLTDSKETPSTPERVQSALYDDILNSVFAKKTAGLLKTRLRAILGIIATAQESLSLNTLADFAGCAVPEARNALTGLRSVLHIPKESSESILIIHPTFPEYLLAPSTTKPELFHFGFANEHSTCLISCLNIMNQSEGSKAGLKRDILELKRDSVLKSEIPDLSRRIKDHIHSSLSYACRYWSIHLSHIVGEGDQLDAIEEPLHSFLTQHALHWLEVCSYLEFLDRAILALDSARRTCEKLGRLCINLCPLLADLYRFTQTYVECISASPLDVYHSALVHAPRDSEVGRVYNPSLQTERSLQICRGAPARWSRLIGALPEAKAERSMAFSPDGLYLATLFGNKVEIWTLTTHALSSCVNLSSSYYSGNAFSGSVAFSPDSTRLAVAGGPGGVAIFEVSSGRLVEGLGSGSSRECSPVMYVANGSRLFAVLGHMAKLWDTSNWSCVLSRQVNSPCAISISPLGTTIASIGGAYDKGYYMRFFDVASETYRPDLPLPDDGQKYERSRFSPNGHHIAVATDRMVRILAVEDAAVIKSVKHPGSRWIEGALVFSPDGRHLAWSDEEGTICIVPVNGGDEDGGHTRIFPQAGHNVVWSPDGTRLGFTNEWGPGVSIWDLSIALQSQTSPSDHPSTSLVEAARFAIVYSGMEDSGMEDRNRIEDDRLPTLLYLPSPAATNALVDFFARQSTYTIELYADMADVLDSTLKRFPLETRRSAEWAYLTGQYSFATEPDAAISPNGELIACRHGSGVFVWNARIAKSLAMFASPNDKANNLVFSPDSALLAVAWQMSKLSGHSTVCIYGLEAGPPICSHIVDGYSGPLVFSPDSSLVSFLSGTTIAALDWRAVQTRREVKGSSSKLKALAVTLGGEYFLSQSPSTHNSPDDICHTQLYRTRQFEYSNAWAETADFSPDDTGLLIRTEDGETHTLKLWNPGERVWPVYGVADDGWVYGKGPGRATRLCWVPHHLREIWTVSKEKFCAVDREQNRAVVYDVSRIPAYIENWGPKSE